MAGATVAALLPVPVAAGTVQVPLPGYPVAPTQPVGQSILPEFVDLDETVVARLTPEGSVAEVVDDLLLKVRGSGDFVIRLPGTARGVENRGGDARPRLEGGHIIFEGHVEGDRQLAA